MPDEIHPPNIIHRIIGTGLYTGYAPLAPGTAGSLLCIIIFSLIPSLHPLLLMSIAAALFFVGIQSSSILEAAWGRDSGKITIDEITGMTVALIGLPKTFFFWTFAFLLFRLFDIFKPPPIRRLEFLPGGWGIMADDIAAGIYTNIGCWILVLIV